MKDFFDLLVILVSLGLYIFAIFEIFLMLRFFYKVFKCKAKIISDLGTIILISLMWVLFFVFMINRVLNSAYLCIQMMFWVIYLFEKRVFAYNNEIFIFLDKVCSINDIKIESEKVLFVSRVTVTTNQVSDKTKTKIVLSLNKKNHTKFKKVIRGEFIVESISE